MWFMYVGGPAHFIGIAREFLIATYEDRQSRIDRPCYWPAPSPGLNLLDYSYGAI